MLVSAWWLFWFMWHCCLNKLSELQRHIQYFTKVSIVTSYNTNFRQKFWGSCEPKLFNLLIQSCVNWSLLSYVVIVSVSKIESALPWQRTLADFLVRISLIFVLFFVIFCENWSPIFLVAIVSGSKIGSALPGQRTLADFLVKILLVFV